MVTGQSLPVVQLVFYPELQKWSLCQICQKGTNEFLITKLVFKLLAHLVRGGVHSPLSATLIFNP